MCMMCATRNKSCSSLSSKLSIIEAIKAQLQFAAKEKNMEIKLNKKSLTADTLNLDFKYCS